MNHTKCYLRDYPRPQFVRKAWRSLNGPWDFRFDKDRQGESLRFYEGFEPQHTIAVPFSYETKASGIHDERACDCVWYARKVKLTRAELSRRVILTFEGVDYLAKVWINGKLAGEHQGGYTRFAFDITDLSVVGDNVITVAAYDGLDPAQPRGKQRWQEKSFGCMYTQTSGIWKTVWLEFRDKRHISAVKITPDYACETVSFACETENAAGLTLCVDIGFDGRPVKSVRTVLYEDAVAFSVDLRCGHMSDETMFWDPEHPSLYDVELSLLDGTDVVDTVGSYFGLRQIEVKEGTVTLNSWAYYQKLVLYQGYWPDSGMTPADEEALCRDILLSKQLGYNGVRCHQKIEDERFYYYADILGLAVWAEMPSTHTFNDRAVENLTREWTAVVRGYYNHPSILVWVPFNESWGIGKVVSSVAQQQFTTAVCHLTKALDGTRPVISNDGWEHTESDLVTLHYYEQDAQALWEMFRDISAVMAGRLNGYPHKATFASGYRYGGQPVIFSEYGGCAFDKDLASGWGYGAAIEDDDSFYTRFKGLTDTLKKLPLAGYCYTQLTDVEQEKNGILTPDRKFKVSLKRIRAINDKPILPK